MGYNATVVVMVDALTEIREDPKFGFNLAQAISKVSCIGGTVDVRAGNHYNAATVVECHHADRDVVVKVGGNYGEVLTNYPHRSSRKLT